MDASTLNSDGQSTGTHNVYASVSLKNLVQLCWMRGGGTKSKKLQDAYKLRFQDAIFFLTSQQSLPLPEHYPIAQVAHNFDVRYDTLPGGSWDFTKMHTLAMSSSSSSAMFRSRLFMNGSSSSVTNQSQSKNRAYEGPYSSSQVGTSNQGRI